MGRAEQRILEALKKNSIWIFGVIVTVLAAFLRFQARGFRSSDMEWYFLPWYEEMKAGGGLRALGKQIGDYNITYQVLIALMTGIHIKPIFLYKGLAYVFDFLLAGVTAVSVWELQERKSWMSPAIVYGIVLLWPTVFANSALWGQCDSIYTFFVMLSLLLLWRSKEKTALVVLGIAAAFKLQAVFVLPFFLIYYVKEKRFSILHFLLSVASFYAMCLPGILSGRSLLAPFTLYIDQKGVHAALYSNFPSFLVFFGNGELARQTISSLTYPVIISILGMALLYLIHRKISLYRTGYFYPAAAWCLWLCILLLPEMHERYAYLLDILLLLSAFVNYRYLAAAIPAVLTGVVTYANYLFCVDYDLGTLSKIYTLAFCIFTFLVVREINAGAASPETEAHEEVYPKADQPTE